MSHVLQLYQLQSIDSEIDDLTRQLTNLAAQLGESAPLRQAKASVSAAETHLRQAHVVMQNLDLEVKTLVTKITQEEKLLYSGRVLSAKEAANLQDEVASLKRRQAEREERLLEAMVEVEEAEAELDNATANLSDVEADWAAGQSDLIETREQLSKKLADAQARRPAMAARIPADELAIYEKLRLKKGGRAVTAVQGGVCQGCGMTPSNSKIQQARAGGELAYCGACGRILYVP